MRAKTKFLSDERQQKEFYEERIALAAGPMPEEDLDTDIKKAEAISEAIEHQLEHVRFIKERLNILEDKKPTAS